MGPIGDLDRLGVKIRRKPIDEQDSGPSLDARNFRHVGRSRVFAVHHIQITMPRGEEAAARAFYSEVLAMSEIVKPPGLAARGGAWFRAGSVELHLGVEDNFHPARNGHPGILVGDLDDVVERLAHDGQDVVWDQDFPGYRRVYAHDPFGNRLEFMEPLAH